jgi:hypothetical protein
VKDLRVIRTVPPRRFNAAPLSYGKCHDVSGPRTPRPPDVTGYCSIRPSEPRRSAADRGGCSRPGRVRDAVGYKSRRATEAHTLFSFQGPSASPAPASGRKKSLSKRRGRRTPHWAANAVASPSRGALDPFVPLEATSKSSTDRAASRPRGAGCRSVAAAEYRRRRGRTRGDSWDGP